METLRRDESVVCRGEHSPKKRLFVRKMGFKLFSLYFCRFKGLVPISDQLWDGLDKEESQWKGCKRVS